jgi:HSP20 family molecular chaperone IbpA
VDIYETADGMVLLVDMPGADDKSIDVTLDKNLLTIAGAWKQKRWKAIP